MLHDTSPRLISTGRGIEDTGRQLEVLAVDQPAAPSTFESLASAVLSRVRKVRGCYIVLAQRDETRARLCAQIRGGSVIFVVAASCPEALPAGSDPCPGCGARAGPGSAVET